MRLQVIRATLTVVVDVLLLGVSVLHIPALLERPDLPFVVELIDGRVVIEDIPAPEVSPAVRVGDALIAWEAVPLYSAHDCEFFADFLKIGDTVMVTTEREGRRARLAITLVPAYSLRYVIIVLIVGLVTWAVGVFVIIARPRELTAAVLHGSLVCMGVVTMLMLGKVYPGSLWTPLTRGLFHFTYAGVAGLYLFFTTLFPVPRPGAPWRRALLIAFLPVSLAILLTYYHVRSLLFVSLPAYGVYRSMNDVFHLLLLVYVAVGTANFVRAYLRSERGEERKKLQWLLWGLSIGPVPFLALVTIPELFVTRSSVPEEFTLLPLVVIPVAFAISFVRYHLLNIDVVINRTTVYTIVVGVLVLVYAAAVGGVSLLVGAYVPESTTMGAVLVGLAFEPARRGVQRLVDRLFFRVQYDYRRTERRFVEAIRQSVDPVVLAELLVQRIDEVIPVERAAVITMRPQGQRLRVVAHRRFDLLAGRGVSFSRDQLRTTLDLPVALRESVEAGVQFEQADERVFRRWGIALVLPIKAKGGDLLGFLVLGRRKSGGRFMSEDVDLLFDVAGRTGQELERVVLQRELIRKQTEAERLRELNAMKSDFVSNVSHELRTPLTSIRLFSELLRARERRIDDKGRSYLEVIEGEATRLDRMVATVLDAAQIERGNKSYVLAPTELGESVRKAFAVMKYQLQSHRFKAKLSGCGKKVRCMIRADGDAVVQALVNLIGNAIKYSPVTKWLHVTLRRRGREFHVTVEDRGQGIPRESMAHILEPFFRDPAARIRAEGVGLGLGVVKHIMDEHGGRIEVSSETGKGSRFTLVFPALEGGEHRSGRRK